MQLKAVYLTTASFILPETLLSEFFPYYLILINKTARKKCLYGCINANCQLLSSYLPM